MADSQAWDSYFKLTLQQLDGLVTSVNGLKDELHSISDEIIKIKERESKVQELITWKQKIDDVVSPSQLDKALKELEDLRMFRTKAVTIFAVIQFLMAVAVMISRFL